jgi:hypothetical protein
MCEEREARTSETVASMPLAFTPIFYFFSAALLTNNFPQVAGGAP